MVAKKKKKKSSGFGGSVIARNRKARHLYHISDNYEAGIVLTGTEVKSLRQGRASLGDAFAKIKDGEIWLMNCHIAEYTEGNRYNHDPMRPRKLLMHKREISKLRIKLDERGYTLVALSMYFVHGKAKVEIGLAKGKKLFDRREDIKKRDETRAMERSMRY